MLMEYERKRTTQRKLVIVSLCEHLFACLLFLEQIIGGKQDQKCSWIVIRLLRLLNITKVECVFVFVWGKGWEMVKVPHIVFDCFY